MYSQNGGYYIYDDVADIDMQRASLIRDLIKTRKENYFSMITNEELDDMLEYARVRHSSALFNAETLLCQCYMYVM